MPISNDLIRDLAPKGCLRVALNIANRVLAASRTTAVSPSGVTIDLSREFARRLGIDIAFEECDTPGKALQVLAAGDADLGFLAVDPVRGKDVYFSRPYVELECGYLAHESSALRHCSEVDQPGCDVFVLKTSAYDLHLTRTLRHATLVRLDDASQVLNAFLRHSSSAVVAAIKPLLIDHTARAPGLRLLEGSFLTVGQAMVLPRRCNLASQTYLEQFTQEMIQGGGICAALERHGIGGALVAGAASRGE